LQALLLEAVFDESALVPALQTFAEICNAPMSQLMVAQRNRTLLRSTFSRQLDQDIGPTEALYQDINPRVLATPFMPKGKATRDKDFISYDDIHKNQTYRELILPAGLGHFSGVPVIHNEEMTAGIALHRHISDAPFSDGEARAHEAASAACAPVLDLASRIERHHVRATVDMFGQGQAVGVLDYRARVRDQNDQFDRFVRSVGATIAPNRKLVLKSEAQRIALHRAIGTHVEIIGGTFVLDSADHTDRWLCRVYPKPAFTLMGPEPGHAILLAERLNQPMGLDQSLVQQVFDLTPTESAICNLLFQGCSLREIAKTRDISIETVRSHLKRILHKTESNRQAELVAKLARFTERSGA
jgi:DNA-binding CsgD family transcriptional regulator